MRRKDREIANRSEQIAVLRRTNVVRMAFNNGEYPYVLTVNYGVMEEGGALWLCFHGSKGGQKHEVIAADPHVSFEVESVAKILPPSGDLACESSTAFESIIGQGIVKAVSENEKTAALDAIMENCGVAARTYAPEHLAATAVYRIEVTAMTGKRHEEASHG